MGLGLAGMMMGSYLDLITYRAPLYVAIGFAAPGVIGTAIASSALLRTE